MRAKINMTLKIIKKIKIKINMKLKIIMIIKILIKLNMKLSHNLNQIFNLQEKKNPINIKQKQKKIKNPSNIKLL